MMAFNLEKNHMDNNTKQVIKQRKPSRNQQIEMAKEKWKKDAEQLAHDKENIGYKDFSWDAFLEIVVEDNPDTTVQSNILDLQERYKELKERQTLIWGEDNVVAEFNKCHAVVHIDQTYILTEKINIFGWQDFSLESRQSFKAYYEDERIVCIDGTEQSKADIWLKSTKRRKYKGVVFDPTTTEHINGYYNLWKGFTKKPIQGNCSRYWQHVKENICSNNEESYHYLRKWLAYVFQHPDIVHAAIVLCGSQGVGKNSFVEPLGVLFGPHYTSLSNISELTSNFNYHLKHATLIHANEALWGGHMKDIGTIKAMITDPQCLIEGKGKDRIMVKNFRHVILSSNEDWPIHLDHDDRRFYVLQVSENHKEDHEYFKSIQEELDSGGYEALLYDLLQEDLTGFSPRIFPSNSNSFSIKMRSTDSACRYLHEVLCEGGFTISTMSEKESPVWQGPIPKDSIFEDYIAWCEKNGEKSLTKTLLCKVIKKVIKSVEDVRPGGESRIRCFKFPSLKQAREEFSKAFKQKPEHIFDISDLP